MTQKKTLKLPKLIGHRGVKDLCPENTLESILKAFDLGLSFVEIDVKISKDRVPILSIGSNRSPYQLKNKFGVKENLCVTPAKLYNSVIVYAASMSAYGSIPATQWPCQGSVSDLNLLWLNQDQLQIMHLSEGLGIAYHFVELDKNTVTIQENDYSGPIFWVHFN